MPTPTANTLLRALEPFSRECSIAGILEGRRPACRNMESTHGDVDSLLIMDRGTPSSYFLLCIEVCRAVLKSVEPAFVFASFRQQVLLRHLSMEPRATPVHILQYLNVKHLFAREPNSLPLAIPEVLVPLAGTASSIAQMLQGGSGESLDNSPKTRRIRYYADIAYEALPLFLNHQTTVLPYAVLVEEAVHKLRFVARHLLPEVPESLSMTVHRREEPRLLNLHQTRHAYFMQQIP